ncbi:hypothetical protein D3C77_736250 [compost metagenome]
MQAEDGRYPLNRRCQRLRHAIERGIRNIDTEDHDKHEGGKGRGHGEQPLEGSNNDPGENDG